jgi:hypothetical protein
MANSKVAFKHHNHIFCIYLWTSTFLLFIIIVILMFVLNSVILMLYEPFFVFRGIVVSLEDGTLKFLSLPRIANDVPVTGRPFVGAKTQGVSTYQLSEHLIWSVHASEIAGAF